MREGEERKRAGHEGEGRNRAKEVKEGRGKDNAPKGWNKGRQDSEKTHHFSPTRSLLRSLPVLLSAQGARDTSNRCLRQQQRFAAAWGEREEGEVRGEIGDKSRRRAVERRGEEGSERRKMTKRATRRNLKDNNAGETDGTRFFYEQSQMQMCFPAQEGTNESSDGKKGDREGGRRGGMVAGEWRVEKRMGREKR